VSLRCLLSRAGRARGFPILLAAIAGACAAPVPSVDAPEDATALAVLGGCPLLPGRIGGQELDVLLDTGSPTSVLDESVARRLGLVTRSYVLPRRHRFVLGTQVRWHYATVERLELGALGVGPLELPLVDLAAGSGYDGGAALIGCDVLRQCRILFEARSRAVRFLGASSPQESGEALRRLFPDRVFAPLAVIWVDSYPYVEVSLGSGPPAKILVDTGALQTSLPLERIRAWGLEPEFGGTETCFVDGLRIGPWRVRLVAKVQDFAPWGALGFDVLSKLTFLWDGPGSALWVAEPRPGEPDTLAAGWFIESYLQRRGLDANAR
jgi:predicted aspartyl protease